MSSEKPPASEDDSASKKLDKFLGDAEVWRDVHAVERLRKAFDERHAHEHQNNKVGNVQQDVRDKLSKRKITDAELDRLLQHPAVGAELARTPEEREARKVHKRRMREKLLRLGDALVDENGFPDSKKIDQYLLTGDLPKKNDV